MKKTFTTQFMKDNKGCYSLEKLNGLSFMATDTVTLDGIINSGIPMRDIVWVMRKSCGMITKQKQLLSLMFAKAVLPIYAAKYPNDNRVSDCVTATEQFINGEIARGELMSKRAAAYAAAADAEITWKQKLINALVQFCNEQE